MYRKNENLNKLTVAYIISVLGDWLYRLGIPLLIYQNTQSALYMAITYGLTYIPNIIFTIIGGAAADHFSKRKILIIGDVMASMFSFAFVFLIFFDLNNTAMSLLFVFIISTVSAFYYPAHLSIIPEIVSEKHFVMANARLRSVDNLLLVLAPSLSALIITVLSIELAIFINACSFLISAFIIYFIKIDDKEEPELKKQVTLKGLINRLREGWIIAFSIVEIRQACFIFIFTNLAMSIFFSNFMYLLKDVYTLSNYSVGVVYSVIGIGALFGSIMSKNIIGKFGEARSIVISIVASSICFLGLLLSNNYITISLSWACVTFFNSVIIVSYFTLRQKSVPKEKLGIVVAITRTIVIVCIPIGSLLGGGLLSLYNNMFYLKILALAFMLIATGYAFTCGFAHNRPNKAQQ